MVTIVMQTVLGHRVKQDLQCSIIKNVEGIAKPIKPGIFQITAVIVIVASFSYRASKAALNAMRVVRSV
jgi:hypothetical protein